MMLRSSLPTTLFALPGAHFSCPLLELTLRDAEQVQAGLLADSQKGLTLATRSWGSTWGSTMLYCRVGGHCQLYTSPN